MISNSFLFHLGVVILLFNNLGWGQGLDNFEEKKIRMIEYQIRKRGIKDKSVLKAMSSVRREIFVPENLQKDAYSDRPLPIGKGQTISQPYIVAFMTEQLMVGPGDRILEIGTGSGYQAAVLGELAKHVYTIEIIPQLAAKAKSILAILGYKNVTVRAGNGYEGWPSKSPFDRIIVTAAPEKIPTNLTDQLANGGRMIIPVGPRFDIQYLWVIEKDTSGKINKKRVLPVRFVPMVKE